ncbi:MAG: phosphotransferase [Pseudomonadales bacterium]|jgi:hypothetical protein|nr:phosphotransferase [Pseudomonadales bacterium]MCP5321567.1 phosphotransferase [Pseudomonadales bacterium]MCP5336480.1 phosphotransferase [Pseudomonadales bacterium]
MTVASTAAAPVSEFQCWWDRQGQWVEPENIRRGGNSGVQLLMQDDPRLPPLYCKRQTGHIYRSLRHPCGQPTILRELQAYEAIARLGIQVPRVVFGGARKHQGQWQALLITEALSGFVSLDHWYAGAPAATLNQAILRQLAASLARLHHARWQHGCCYPKHIFVKAETLLTGDAVAEVALLDLEKCRHRLRVANASSRDMAQLARHWGAIPAADLDFLHRSYATAFNAS